METINPQFEKELEMLRQRLEEAEDVRRAITHGEVDAFVIGPGGNGRVLLLANAYQRYRQVVERMQQGVVTATPGGQILFANQRFADMLGIPLAQLYTAVVSDELRSQVRARTTVRPAISTTASMSSIVRPGLIVSTRISHSSSARRPRMSKLILAGTRPLSGRVARWRSMACTMRPPSGLKCCSSGSHAPPACTVGL